MKFQDYLIESWKDYKLSKSPKVLLYDFYLLSYISSLILDPGTRKDVGLTGVGYSGKFFGREGKELDLDIQNAQRKLLPFLGTKLSQALFIAVTSELRHVQDRNQKWSEFKHTKNKTFRNYIRNLELMSNKELQDFHSNRNIEQPELAVESAGRKISYQAAKKAIKETGGNVIDFARMAADAFKDLNWSQAYGGPAWAAIADGYVDLRQALDNYNPEAPSPSSESAEKLIAAIDHAFDLEHNTGTVLNKVKYFAVNGDYSWIKQALDDKRDSDMYIIASKASSDMRKLGHEVLKVAGMQDRQLKQVPATAGIPKKERRKEDLENIEGVDIIPNKSTGGMFKRGDVVKVKNEKGTEGIVKNIYKGEEGANLAQIKITKSDGFHSVGILTWYNEDHLEKISGDSSELKVGDIVKFNYKQVYGKILRIAKHDNSTFYEVEITKSSDPQAKVGQKITTVAGGVEKAEASRFNVGDKVKFDTFSAKGEGIIESIKNNYNPEHSYAEVKVTKAEVGCKRGDIVMVLFTFLQKMAKPIKLQGFAAAYADEPAPREDENEYGEQKYIDVGGFFLLSNEKILVEITEMDNEYITYKIIAAVKQYKSLEGKTNTVPRDMFSNEITFKIPPEDVDHYIREFKKKR